MIGRDWQKGRDDTAFSAAVMRRPTRKSDPDSRGGGKDKTMESPITFSVVPQMLQGMHHIFGVQSWHFGFCFVSFLQH